MINGLDIYYSNVERGLKPVSTKVNGFGLRPVGNKQKTNRSKPISKGLGCVKGNGLKVLQ